MLATWEIRLRESRLFIGVTRLSLFKMSTGLVFDFMFEHLSAGNMRNTECEKNRIDFQTKL